MHTDKDKIKDIFASRLGKFEPTVPDKMWDKIAAGLPQEQKIRPRAKKTVLYKQFAAIASAAAIIALCFLFINNNDETTAKQITDSFNIEELNPNYQPKQIIVEAFPTNNLSKGNQSTILTVANNNTNNVTTKQEESPAIIEKAKSEQDAKVSDTEDNIPQDKSVEKNDPDLKKKIEEFANQGNTPIFATDDKTTKTISKKNNLTLSLGGQTGFYNNGDSRAKVQSTLRKFALETQNTITQDVALSGYEKYFNDIPVKVDHNQPISFGLMISKNINSKLSIETGLVYTYLSSKIQSEKKSIVKRVDRQYFHYLGLPISLNYTFASWGKAEFYASAGGMIQKDIQGRYKEEQDLDLKNEQSSLVNKENIHQNKPQLSVLGRVGASYPIYDKLHLYTTVGGAYYFDANNKYRTIYSDKKLQLDVNIGLKLKF